MPLQKNINFWYHLCMIVLYLILIPIFIIFTPNAINYKFTYNNLFPITLIICLSILSFFCLFRRKIGVDKIKLKFPSYLSVILYGLIIAFAEEIIFRGLIQSLIQSHFIDTLSPILLSSLIFGIAHLPNGAKSFNFKGWNWRFAGIVFLS